MPYKLPAMKRKTLDPITPCDGNLTPEQWLDKHTGEDLIIALARFALTFRLSDIRASELYLKWAGWSTREFSLATASVDPVYPYSECEDE